MKKHLPIAMRSTTVILGCLLLYGCYGNSNQLHVVKKESEGTITPQQTVSMKVPQSQRTWHTIKQYAVHNGSVTMLAPDNESMDNWNENIRSTVILYKDAPGITADQFVQQQVRDANTDCQNVSTKILVKTRQYITYRAETANCAIMENQQVHYGKAFNGSDGVYGILYSAKVRQVPQRRINYMAGIIKSSRLIHNPQKNK